MRHRHQNVMQLICAAPRMIGATSHLSKVCAYVFNSGILLCRPCHLCAPPGQVPPPRNLSSPFGDFCIRHCPWLFYPLHLSTCPKWKPMKCSPYCGYTMKAYAISHYLFSFDTGGALGNSGRSRLRVYGGCPLNALDAMRGRSVPHVVTVTIR